MLSRIHILPPLLANQIAAGEVVERPASVIKELLENSLDAGATQLNIHLLKGGCQLIRIQDNGSGIHPEDMPLALARHATSKIHHPADLAQIQTLGFRGEALASIASISRVKITSQYGEYDALSVTAQGREMAVTVLPASHPRGTTVEVADLFYNTPARRKFLKSERTEFLHIEEMIKRMALARPEVGFDLYHDGKLVKRYVQVTHHPLVRIEQVLSKSFIEKAIKVDDQLTAFQLEGWLGDVSLARSSNDMQYCYVNGRMVRDKMLSHAIRLAYEDKIYPGRFPAYILHLNCDPASVDVNVHPTKHEVRFRDARLVHDFILSALQKRLNPVVVAPELPQREEHSTLLPVTLPLERQAPLRQKNQGAPTQSYSRPPAGFSTLYQARCPLGEVVTVLDKRVVILQQDQMLRAVNWHKTLQNFLFAQWKYHDEQEEKPKVPLICPVQIIHEQAENLVQKCLKLGCTAQMIGPAHLIIRELPRFLHGIDEEVFTAELFQQPLEQIRRSLAEAWIKKQSLQHKEIERMLEGIHSLSKDLLVSKDYVPEMLI